MMSDLIRMGALRFVISDHGYRVRENEWKNKLKNGISYFESYQQKNEKGYNGVNTLEIE